MLESIEQLLFSYNITAVVYCSFFIFLEMSGHLRSLATDVTDSLNGLTAEIVHADGLKMAGKHYKAWKVTQQARKVEETFRRFMQFHWDVIE